MNVEKRKKGRRSKEWKGNQKGTQLAPSFVEGRTRADTSHPPPLKLRSLEGTISVLMF